MRAAKTGDTLVLTFGILESRVLQNTLREIVLNYQVKPEDMAPKAASAWYSTRGCEAAKLSAEETREWVEALHQYKSANVKHLVKWSRALEVPTAGQRQIKLKLDEASILLTALNDHRLLLAARHDIGQAEMDVRTLSALASLPASRQAALSEIHLLAGIMEELLCFLPGNPAGWMETLL